MNNKKPIRFVENVNQTFGKEAFRIEKRDGVMCLIAHMVAQPAQIECCE